MAEDRNMDDVVTLSEGRMVAFQVKVAKQLPHLAEDEREQLARALQRVAQALRPARIYVFGSYARGQQRRTSEGPFKRGGGAPLGCSSGAAEETADWRGV